jgi:hypothetical protein
VLNGMDHWFLEVGEEEMESQVPSILQLQEEVNFLKFLFEIIKKTFFSECGWTKMCTDADR